MISSIRIVASPAGGGNRLCCCQCTQELRCFRPNWRFAGAGLGECGRCVRGRRLGGGRARRVFIGSSRHGDGTTMPPRAKARRHHGPVLPRSSARSGGCKIHEQCFFFNRSRRPEAICTWLHSPRLPDTCMFASNRQIFARSTSTVSPPPSQSVRGTTTLPSHIIQHLTPVGLGLPCACFFPMWL